MPPTKKRGGGLVDSRLFGTFNKTSTYSRNRKCLISETTIPQHMSLIYRINSIKFNFSSVHCVSWESMIFRTKLHLPLNISSWNVLNNFNFECSLYLNLSIKYILMVLTVPT
jgi:hypothetical protein